MNRYSVWKYITMFVVLFIAILYALPNYFGESPAVQVAAVRIQSIDADLQQRILSSLTQANLQPEMVEVQDNSVLLRFADTNVQLKARDVIDRAINTNAQEPDYSVALNLVSRSPKWLSVFGASPMYLGLDLRGGVHFTLEVDVQTALKKRLDALAVDARKILAEQSVQAQITSVDTKFTVTVANAAIAKKTQAVLKKNLPELLIEPQTNSPTQLIAYFNATEEKNFQESAVKQNILTLKNRINELGVAEPIIQQQGVDRVVVQLPGIQDTAKAKEILGRTATLEIRLVDETPQGLAAEQVHNQALLSGQAQSILTIPQLPFNSELFMGRANEQGQRYAYVIKKDILLTGNNLTDAQAGFDQNQQPTVNLTLDSQGARDFQIITRNNINKRLAILLFEKGRGEVVTAPVINTEIPGGRVQITGSRSVQEAADTALLLRSGSLAAPMEIIEERTIGPGLGAENIDKGFRSVTYGFVAVVIFMSVYYMLFGVISSIALGVNLLLLVAVLSMLQATLTLPGMAAMGLTLGMAIDANVLINERIREELRTGATPQVAIHTGYENAWSTIIDSNLTSLIAGLALLVFGSGAVRGFAVVHSLGILTSLFSAVFFSRGLVSLWYGRKRKLEGLSIGTVWRPQTSSAGTVSSTQTKD